MQAVSDVFLLQPVQHTLTCLEDLVNGPDLFRMVGEENIHVVVPAAVVLDGADVVVEVVASEEQRVVAELLEAAASMSPTNLEWLDFVM